MTGGEAPPSLKGTEDRLATLDLAGSDDERLSAMLDDVGPLVQQESWEASRLLAAITSEAARRGLDEVEATGSYLQARAEVNLGHLDSALDLIARARRLWIDAGQLVSAWRTDLGRMHVLDDQGRHHEAIAVGEALVDNLRAAELDDADTGEAEWLLAAASENLGVCHGYLGHHSAALDAYAHAETAYRSLGMHDEVPRPMANRGVELIEVGRPYESIPALQEAARGFEANGDHLYVAKCLAYLARAQLLCGSYLEAAAATQRATAYLEGQDTTTDYARIELVRAETLASLNLLNEALYVYDRVISKLEDAALQHDLAAAHQGRARTLTRLGRNREAWESFSRAEALYRTVGAAASAASASLGKSELADPVEARRLAEDARVVLEDAGRAGDYGSALLRLAQLARSPAEAAGFLDSVAAILDEHDLPHLLWRERHERGRLLLSQGKPVAARAALEQALELLDALRSTVAAEHHRLPFMAGREAVLDDLLQLLLAEGDVSAAYAMTNRARARTLVERLSGTLPASTAPPSSAELDAIYSQLLRAPGLDASRLRRDARDLEHDRMVLAAAATSREVPAWRRAEFGATPVLTYQTVGEELVAFVHRGDSLIAVTEMAAISAVRHMLDRLDAQWRRFDDPGLVARQQRHLLAATVDLLQQLHISLLAPLPNVLDNDSLLVVPCEPLGNVPFAALHDGTCHLVERLAVTVSPSLSVAHLAGTQRRTSRARRLAVGVVDDDTPDVAKEISAVAANSEHATVLLDDEATVAAFEENVADHDVLHLACHGVHRPDNPLFSALRLADRWLTAAEIARLDLDGQLVILSACSSGRQEAVGTGDELVGLPRAFLAAGAASVIVNLWPVTDDSSAALMTRLHHWLGDSEPAAALRRAQLDLLADLPHPYHWAPAVVLGAPRNKNNKN
jgi:CHAT domain-containing protein/tetratricopeptide (TPR) repeat protein